MLFSSVLLNIKHFPHVHAGQVKMAQALSAVKKAGILLFLTASSATAFYLAAAVGWWAFWW